MSSDARHLKLIAEIEIPPCGRNDTIPPKEVEGCHVETEPSGGETSWTMA